MEANKNLTCRLTGEEFRKRKALLKKEIFEAVGKIVELNDGYLFKFEEEGGFGSKLMELDAAERACCPFFEIKLHFQPYKKGIDLEISGQEGVKEFLKTELLS